MFTVKTHYNDEHSIYTHQIHIMEISEIRMLYNNDQVHLSLRKKNIKLTLVISLEKDKFSEAICGVQNLYAENYKRNSGYATQ